MPFSNYWAAKMVNMIITALNMPDTKITPEVYDALFFLFNKFPNLFLRFSLEGLNNHVNKLFQHIDLKYNSMNFRYFPLTFTFSTTDSLSEHALRSLTAFLTGKGVGPQIKNKQSDDWHNHALTYFHNYSRNNKDRVSRKRANDPVYNAIVDLLKVTSKLGTGSSPVNSDELLSPGSSPLTRKDAKKGSSFLAASLINQGEKIQEEFSSSSIVEQKIKRIGEEFNDYKKWWNKNMTIGYFYNFLCFNKVHENLCFRRRTQERRRYYE